MYETIKKEIINIIPTCKKNPILKDFIEKIYGAYNETDHILIESLCFLYFVLHMCVG